VEQIARVFEPRRIYQQTSRNNTNARQNRNLANLARLYRQADLAKEPDDCAGDGIQAQKVA